MVGVKLVTIVLESTDKQEEEARATHMVVA